MPSIRVELDDAKYKRLTEVAPAAKRQRSEFVRSAVKEAIRMRESTRIRAAYEKLPDSTAEADDRSNCEEFKA
jgi:predicted transcriptional regulator